MKYLLNILLLFVIIFTDCKKKDNTNETVQPVTHSYINLQFLHYVNGKPWQLDTMIYVNAAGNPYKIISLQYFISQVTLHSSNTSATISNSKEIDGIHYVDNTIPSSLGDTMLATAGKYDSISFTFGINAALNKTELFVNPPQVNMSWPDLLGGGYHYMKLNGFWKDSISKIESFNFHLGIGQIYKNNDMNVDSITGYVQNYFTVDLPASAFTLTQGATKTIQIIMNIEKWFQGAYIFNFNKEGADIMMNQNAMNIIKVNGKHVFTVGSMK